MNFTEYITPALSIFTLFYTFLSLTLTIGLLRNKKGRSGWEPEISIVIPARNEEENIVRCLDSVAALDYPAEKIRVIVIDDHSDDRTAEIAEEYIQSFPDFSFLKLDSIPESGTGKIAGLIQGYKHSKGEVVFQTDADCSVHPEWISTMLRQFDEKTGIVGGITILEEFHQRNSCFTQIQSLDWIYLLSVGVGGAGIGVPLSSIGNNTAIRKTAYDSIGGYAGIPYSVTEDFAIFRALVKKGWKSGFAAFSETLTLSSPPGSLTAFLRQRSRWAIGALKIAGPGIVLITAAYFLHLCTFAALLFGISASVILQSVFVKMAADLLFLYVATRKTGRLSLLKYFPLFEIYYYLSTTFLGLFVPFLSGVSWKGRQVST